MKSLSLFGESNIAKKISNLHIALSGQGKSTKRPRLLSSPPKRVVI